VRTDKFFSDYRLLGPLRARPRGHPTEHAPRPAAAQVPRAQPVEKIWQFMRDNRLSNRVFRFYTNILDHGWDAWNKLHEFALDLSVPLLLRSASVTATVALQS
jgi:hypothetical protein